MAKRTVISPLSRPFQMRHSSPLTSNAYIGCGFYEGNLYSTHELLPDDMNDTFKGAYYAHIHMQNYNWGDFGCILFLNSRDRIRRDE
jgi:hypothetical protein